MEALIAYKKWEREQTEKSVARSDTTKHGQHERERGMSTNEEDNDAQEEEQRQSEMSEQSEDDDGHESEISEREHEQQGMKVTQKRRHDNTDSSGQQGQRHKVDKQHGNESEASEASESIHDTHVTRKKTEHSNAKSGAAEPKATTQQEHTTKSQGKRRMTSDARRNESERERQNEANHTKRAKVMSNNHLTAQAMSASATAMSAKRKYASTHDNEHQREYQHRARTTATTQHEPAWVHGARSDGDSIGSQATSPGNETFTLTQESIGTGRGHTVRTQATRYGHNPPARIVPERKKAKKGGITKVRGASAARRDAHAGPRTLLIRIGHRLRDRMEGTYEDHNAPT